MAGAAGPSPAELRPYSVVGPLPQPYAPASQAAAQGAPQLQRSRESSASSCRSIMDEPTRGSLTDRGHLAEPVAAARRPRPFDRAAFWRSQCFIIDCDEGSFLGENREVPDPAIVERLNDIIRYGRRVLFICNSCSWSRRTYVQRLFDRGVQLCDRRDPAAVLAAERNIVTLGHTAAWYLKRSGFRQPLVVTSRVALVEDLRAAGFPGCPATVADDGEPLEAYSKPVSEPLLSRLLAAAPEADCVVLGSNDELTSLKVAVIAKCLQRNSVQDAVGGRAPALVTSCGPELRRKLRAQGSSSVCRAVGASFAPDTAYVDARMPADMLVSALRSPEAEGGYGVDFEKTVVIGSSLDTGIELANRAGMTSLFVTHTLMAQMGVAIEMRPSRLPDWILPSLAEV